MKICLIAQVENWRGGIQQYSQNYAESLAQKTETVIIGYSSYFPLWLYPGEKVNIPAQTCKWKGKVPIYNILKYYSLLSVLKAFWLIKKKLQPDIVDIQWCTTFHAPILIPLIFLLKYFSTLSVVLTVHNVLPHEKRFFDKPLCRIVYRLSDRLIVHSREMKNHLTNEFDTVPEKVSIVPHGVCLNFQNKIPREKAKKQLGIKESKVILFFGFIRKYKGLEHLIAAFKDIKSGFDVALVIAGDFIEEKERYENLISDSGMQDKIYIYPGYISDDDAPYFFSAANALVLPYVAFDGQTGLAPTAYSYSLPVIATDVGGLSDIVIHNKTGLIIKPKSPTQIADAIKFFLQHPEKLEAYGINAKQYVEKELSWDRIAKNMLEVYSDVSTRKEKTNACSVERRNPS